MRQPAVSLAHVHDLLEDLESEVRQLWERAVVERNEQLINHLAEASHALQSAHRLLASELADERLGRNADDVLMARLPQREEDDRDNH